MSCRMVRVLLWATLCGCSGVQSRDWWEHAQLYQIYPRSFMDTDGDGVGDLKGIIQKLDHLKDAGVDGVWLSPIFTSPMVDFGYDISDYENIQPEYGTMEDFTALVEKCKSLGIKLILDFVPNHTSDKHEWFINSANKDKGFEDFYVWSDGKVDPDDATKRIPPNNWVSIFYGSAWTWHEARGQFYLHQFHEKQPDLNYRSDTVVQKMKDVLVYWMDLGADGFRIDAVPFLFEDPALPDEPLSGATEDSQDYGYLVHDNTMDQPATFDMMTQWRSTLDQYTAENGGDTRVMMVEAYTTPDILVNYFGNETNPGAHFPFNFNFINRVSKDSKADDFVAAVNDWTSRLPNENFVGANWVIGNHDQSRVTTRYGEGRVDGIAMIIMLLPGVGVTYQGDEIAMTDRFLTWEETKDPQACNTNPEVFAQHTRDPGRTPFQWDASKNAGFSTADSTWLPVATNYLTVNLAAQQTATKSHYKTFQAISDLRRAQSVFADGDLVVKALQPDVFAFRRSLAGSPSHLVVVNLSASARAVSLAPLGSDLPVLLSIVITSTNAYHVAGRAVETRNLILGPYEALVLRTNI